MERQDLMLSLSHIAEDEWRARFMGDNPLLAPKCSAWRHRAGYTGRRVGGATVSDWRWPIVAASVLLVPDVALSLGLRLNMW